MPERARLAVLVAAALSTAVGCTVGFQDPADDDDTESGAPVMSDLQAEPDYERWKLHADFAWSDPQSNVREGSFYVYLDDELHETYDLPHTSVTLLSDTGELKTDLTPFTAAELVEIGLVLEDVDGNLSNKLAGPVDLGRTFHHEQEPNDTPGGGQQLGPISVPGGIYGDLTSLSGQGDGDYTGDVDFYKFSLDQGANLSFTLTWPSSYNDLGMFLLVGGDSTPWISADEHSLDPPEEMAAPLSAGTTYTVAVAGSSGKPITYVLLLDGAE